MKPPKIEIYNRGTKAKPNYWVRYTWERKQEREPTKARTREDARAFVEQTERAMRLDQFVAPSKRDGNISLEGETFQSFAPKAIARRRAKGLGVSSHEETHVRVHLNSLFGAVLVRDITYKMACEKFAELRRKPAARGTRRGEPLAGATLRNIHATWFAVMKEAAKDGLLPMPPQPLSVIEGDLPPVDDSRGDDWRESARFFVEDVAALMGCEGIEAPSRVFYLTAFMTGTRFAEVNGLYVRDYDPTRKPLACMTFPAKKTGRRTKKRRMKRQTPVHPQLKSWLDWWLREEYEVVHGHPPRPDDLLFPTLSALRRNRGQQDASHSEVYHRWARYHLPAAELAHRRLHDTRRTFISLYRAVSDTDDLLRKITHQATGDTVLDGYTSYEWKQLCDTILRVEWHIPNSPGAMADVIHLPRYERRSRG
jgi:hypothetical protein